MSVTHTNPLKPFYQVKSLDPEDFHFTSSTAEITLSAQSGGLISLGSIVNDLSTFNGMYFSGSGDFSIGDSTKEYIYFLEGTSSIETQNFKISGQDVEINSASINYSTSSNARIITSTGSSFMHSGGSSGGWTVTEDAFYIPGMYFSSNESLIAKLGYIAFGKTTNTDIDDFAGMFISSSGDIAIGSSSGEYFTYSSSSEYVKYNTANLIVDSSENQVVIRSTANSISPLVVSGSEEYNAPLQIWCSGSGIPVMEINRQGVLKLITPSSETTSLSKADGMIWMQDDGLHCYFNGTEISMSTST